jgi:hypothetical protein
VEGKGRAAQGPNEAPQAFGIALADEHHERFVMAPRSWEAPTAIDPASRLAHLLCTGVRPRARTAGRVPDFVQRVHDSGFVATLQRLDAPVRANARR